jgi:hypothetical protein
VEVSRNVVAQRHELRKHITWTGSAVLSKRLLESMGAGFVWQRVGYSTLAGRQ